MIDADKICIFSPSNPQSSMHLFCVFLLFMMEEVSCQKLNSPRKLCIICPLILSGFTPQIPLFFLSSLSPSPLEHSHQQINLLCHSCFKILYFVLLYPFSYHLFLYLSSQQNCERSCMNLHLLIFTHFSTLQVPRLPTLYWNGFWQSQILPSWLNNVTII